MPGPYTLQPCPDAAAPSVGIALTGPVPIPPGTLLVGRQNLTDPSCKRVSRRQLVLHYSPEEGALTVSSDGTNPSYVLFAEPPGDGESLRPIPTSKAPPIPLRAGDRVTLHGPHGVCVVAEAAGDAATAPLKRKDTKDPLATSSPKRRAVDPSPMYLMSVDTLPLTPDDAEGTEALMRLPTRRLSSPTPTPPRDPPPDVPAPPAAGTVADTLPVADLSDTESASTELLATSPVRAPAAEPEPDTPSTDVMEDEGEAGRPGGPAVAGPTADMATLVVEEGGCAPTLLVDTPATSLLPAPAPPPAASPPRSRQAALSNFFAPRGNGAPAATSSLLPSISVPPVPASRSLALLPLDPDGGHRSAGAKAIQEFLVANKELKVQLRLLCADGAEVQRWRTALAGVVDERLSVAVGDGADGAGSWCLAAPVSWRFKGASPLMKAAGPSVEEAAKRQYKTGTLGHAYLVDVPPTSPFSLCGAQHLVLVVMPNTQPGHPDCVTDPTAVDALVYECYASALRTFASACTRGSPLTGTEPAARLPTGSPTGPSPCPAGPLGRYRPPAGKAQTAGPWQDVLVAIVRNLERFADVVYFADDRCVAIYDAYPKATVHLLLLPRDLSLQGLHSLRPKDIDLLEHLQAVAARLVRHLQAEQFPRLTFQVGFHSLPSLRHLHLHLISRDFHASDSLKNKKHWNSFTTDFFLPVEQALGMLRSGGCIAVDTERAKALEAQSLECPLCHAPAGTIPAAKRHYQPCYDKHRTAWTAQP
eukprot:EG_transcript_3506